MKNILALGLMTLFSFFAPSAVHAFSFTTTGTDIQIDTLTLSPEDQKKLNPDIKNIKLFGLDGKEISKKTEDPSGTTFIGSVTVDGAKSSAGTTTINSSRNSSLSIIGSDGITAVPIDATPKAKDEPLQKKDIKTLPTEPPLEIKEVKKSVPAEEKKEIVPEVKPLPEIKKDEVKESLTVKREKVLQEYFEKIQTEEAKNVLATDKKTSARTTDTLPTVSQKSSNTSSRPAKDEIKNVEIKKVAPTKAKAPQKNKVTQKKK